MKKRFLLLLLPLMLLAGCGNNPSPDPDPQITITLSETEHTIHEDNSFTLTATVTGSSEAVVWTTSNNAVAYVTNGTVFAKTEGKCDIKATVSGVTAACALTVLPADQGIYSIKTEDHYNVELGQQVDITSEVHYILNGIDNIVSLATEYISLDTRVFKVENNKIVPVKNGTGTLLFKTDKVEKRVQVTIFNKIINTTADYLDMIKNRDPFKSYLLNADLDFDQVAYTGFSNKKSFENSETFKGQLEGNGHTISNITINCDSGNYYSLFGNIDNAAIKDVNFKNVKFVNSNNASGLSALVTSTCGCNTHIENIYLEADFDATSSQTSGNRFLLFNGYDNAVGIAESKYTATISNVVIVPTFKNNNPETLGFKVCSEPKLHSISNIYVYSKADIPTKLNKSVFVFTSKVDLVYTLNSVKKLGMNWNYSVSDVILPTVKAGVNTLSDTILTSVNGDDDSIKGYQIVADFPFVNKVLGYAYGDYGNVNSKVSNEFLTTWHSLGKGNNPNPLIDVKLNDYYSLVFYAKCPDGSYITTLGDGGRELDPNVYEPKTSVTWKKIEIMNNGNNTYTLKFDGKVVNNGYRYTNLNEFDFCFNSYKFYISELFGKAK